MNDLRFALRQLLKQPAFTATVVLTLALCIGANSAIFSIVHAVLLRPLPYPDADRLVYVHNSYPKSNLLKAGASIPDYLDRATQATALESAALFTWESFNLADGDQPQRVLGLRTTPSLFTTLRMRAHIGRTFSEAEAEPGRDRVVILSHALWQERFGGRESILGQSIRLHAQSYTVIGVMPAGFQFPQPEVLLWVPFAFTAEQRSDQERGHEFSSMIARLKPGVSARQLEAECATLIQRNLQRLPDARAWVESSGFSAAVVPVLEDSVGNVQSMLWLVQAGVAAALLVGCVNVGNLLIARASARRRELAVRSALGASPWHMVRQLGAECLVLFSAGGVLGGFVAQAGLSASDALGIHALPRGTSSRLDLPVFFFTLATLGVVALVFGLLPAWHASRVDAAESLRDGCGRSSAGHGTQRLRHALVVAEVALAVMLVSTAGVLVHSFAQLQQQTPGFDRTSALTARLTLPPSKFPEDDQRLAFASRLVSDLRALPGVTAVGFTDSMPFGYQNSQGTYYIDGSDLPDGQTAPHGLLRSVSAGYFAAMRIPLLQGRSFNDADMADAEQVVIVDRVFAERHFPGRSPVGQRIYRNPNQRRDQRTIIGVVGAVKHQGLDDPTRKETLYFPYAQRPVESFTLVLRTASDPNALLPSLRKTIQRIDPEQPVYDATTLESRISQSLQRQRVPMRLLSLFGFISLLLAALGIYGVLAFNVGQRTREFGIRTSLGATSRQVCTMVLTHGLRMATLGVIAGLLSYLLVSQSLRSFVFGVTPLDPAALAGACLSLLLVALAASWIPARRAAAVDPIEALRNP